ncbi:MAG TPA: hypothetical protein VFA04_23435 [Bryobacteraceae bacterium]|nr:hypothetical protein [Bryobacteraceae bacterium]
MRGLWLAAVFGFAALAGVADQKPPPQTEVRVPFWVEAGETTGPPQSFSAKLDGTAAPILAMAKPGTDEIILIVLDLTGDLSKADAARQAVAQQTRELKANEWIGLLRAQDGLSVLVDPTADREKVNQAFAAVPISGKAGLLDTMQQMGVIADAMAARAPVRVSVLYITDSNIYNYREDYTNPVINSSDPHDLSRRFSDALIRGHVSRMAEELAAQQSPVFIVHVNYRYDRLNEAYQNGLKTLAEATGGAAIFCRSPEEIQDGIARALASIHSEWMLTLGLPKKLPASVQLRLTATAAGGAEVRLQYRTRFSVRRR